MGNSLPTAKPTAVQAASVFLDREATIDKACDLIASHAACAEGPRQRVSPDVPTVSQVDASEGDRPTSTD